MTVNEAKRVVSARLKSVTPSFEFESREIVKHFTGMGSSDILLNGNMNLSKKQCKNMLKACKKRIKGVPLQYILGIWEFYSLPFYVGYGVLIPRPDTELLVEKAVEEIKDKNAVVFDLCAGSGAVGIAIKKNCSLAEVTMVEKSRNAFKYLKKNCVLNNINANIVRADIKKFRPKEAADLVVSNPPYLKKSEMQTLSAEVKREPKTALDGGLDGLCFYRYIANFAEKFLKPGGCLMFEIGYTEALEVEKILQNAGFDDIKVYKDINGNDRIIAAKYSLKSC